MAYKLSERRQQDLVSAKNNAKHYKRHADDEIHFGKLALVFLGFGLLSLFTSLVMSMETNSYGPFDTQELRSEIGPVQVKKHNEVYKIEVEAKIPSNAWSVIEGQVLDANKQYLFSFSEELWRENGYDSEGAWSEAITNYEIDVTFNKPGYYYLQFLNEVSQMNSAMSVKVSKKRGSHIPHLWFGIFLLLIAVILNEISNRTLRDFAEGWE